MWLIAASTAGTSRLSGKETAANTQRVCLAHVVRFANRFPHGVATTRRYPAARRAANCSASVMAAIRLDGSAMPLPAISYAVP